MSNRRMDTEAVVHISNGIVLSLKKNELMSSAATWVDPEPTITQRKTNIWHHLYVKPKRDTDELIYKTDLELQM